MANSFTGTFSTPAKQAEFMAITTSVAGLQFWNETGLTTISLPEATTIGYQAFRDSHLTSISLQKATSIGGMAFWHSKLTNLDLPEAITIEGSAFESSPLTSLSLPKATTIGPSAFWVSKLTTLDLPKATTIRWGAFNDSKLTTLDLSEAIIIDDSAFHSSPLTSLSIPKATTIGDNAFYGIVNASTTTVVLPSKFNNTTEKDRIFGAGKWNHIKFLVKPTKSFIGFGGKWISKPFEAKHGKRLKKITMGGKTLTLFEKYTLSDNGELSDGTKSFGKITAIVTSSNGSSGNTHFYNQTFYGKPNVHLLYTRDTGANNANQSINALPLIPKGRNAKLTFITKPDDYSVGTGWTEHKYDLVYNSDGSVSFNGNTVALNAHKMVWQFGWSGGWTQTWIYNTPAGVQFKYGAGSGIGTRHALALKEIEF